MRSCSNPCWDDGSGYTHKNKTPSVVVADYDIGLSWLLKKMTTHVDVRFYLFIIYIYIYKFDRYNQGKVQS